MKRVPFRDIRQTNADFPLKVCALSCEEISKFPANEDRLKLLAETILVVFCQWLRGPLEVFPLKRLPGVQLTASILAAGSSPRPMVSAHPTAASQMVNLQPTQTPSLPSYRNSHLYFSEYPHSLETPDWLWNMHSMRPPKRNRRTQVNNWA